MKKYGFTWKGLVGVAVGISVLLALFGRGRSSSETDPSGPLLKVSAGKSAMGFLLTNREPGPVSQCDVTLLDQGDAQWFAAVQGSAVPSQTLSVPWSSFRDNGQPMPSYIGQSRDNFIVSCFVESENARRTAGVHF